MSRENSYASLDADGQVPLDQLDNAAGGGPHSHAGEDITSGTVADARVASALARDTEITSAVSAHEAAGNPHAVYATDGDLTTHAGTAHGVSSHAIDGAFHSGTSVLPTTGQKNALAGTSGTPGTGNEYVTTQDARMTDERAPTAHAHLDGDIPAGIARDSEVATAVSDHAAAANPHAVYLTQAEGDAAYEATGATATHAGLADPHTGYRLESADHSHASTGLQAGTVAHTALTSVGIDDHHARDHAINGATHTGTLDDAQIPAGIARDAEVATAVSDHAALADPHTGYRLESADHTHATTGAQAGQVAHSALSGITANDHHNQAHVLTGADHTASGLTIGHVLTASSATAFGFAAPPGGDLITTPADFAINNVADQTIATRAVTLAAGDQVTVDAWFTILNNSTATRVITLTLDFDDLFDIELATGALATSATLIHPMKMSAILDVRSTSLAYAMVQLDMQLLAGIASGGDTTAGATLMNAMGWGTSAGNATGSTNVTLRARSANATATQTLRLHHFSVRKVTPN